MRCPKGMTVLGGEREEEREETEKWKAGTRILPQGELQGPNL